MKYRVKGFQTFTGMWKWHVLGSRGEIHGMYVDWNLAVSRASRLAFIETVARTRETTIHELPRIFTPDNVIQWRPEPGHTYWTT